MDEARHVDPRPRRHSYDVGRQFWGALWRSAPATAARLPPTGRLPWGCRRPLGAIDAKVARCTIPRLPFGGSYAWPA